MERNDFLVVLNPQAGKGRALAYEKRIKELFVLWGAKSRTVFTAKDGDNSPFSLGRMAVREKVDTLLAVSGDGTQNLLFNGMMAEAAEKGISSEALPKLGLIRSGTGNNLAKNVGIPEDLDEAMLIVRNGHTLSVDVGLVASPSVKKYFLNVVSFGFDALVVKKVSDFKEKREKRCFASNGLIYFLFAAQKILSGFPSYGLVLSGSRFNLETEACLLAALIGPTYGDIFHIAPGADSTDGLFDVCLINKVGKVKAVELLLRATKGKHIGQPQVRNFKLSDFTVSCTQALPCEVDGEFVSLEKEYQVSILGKGLRVIAPSQFATAQRPLAVKMTAPECQSA